MPVAPATRTGCETETCGRGVRARTPPRDYKSDENLPVLSSSLVSEGGSGARGFSRRGRLQPEQLAKPSHHPARIASVGRIRCHEEVEAGSDGADAANAQAPGTRRD